MQKVELPRVARFNQFSLPSPAVATNHPLTSAQRQPSGYDQTPDHVRSLLQRRLLAEQPAVANLVDLDSVYFLQSALPVRSPAIDPIEALGSSVSD